MEVESQVIVKFPLQLVCSACENFLCGPLGMYCGYWREEVVSEDVAEECDAFQHS